LDLILK